MQLFPLHGIVCNFVAAVAVSCWNKSLRFFPHMSLPRPHPQSTPALLFLPWARRPWEHTHHLWHLMSSYLWVLPTLHALPLVWVRECIHCLMISRCLLPPALHTIQWVRVLAALWQHTGHALKSILPIIDMYWLATTACRRIPPTRHYRLLPLLFHTFIPARVQDQ